MSKYTRILMVLSIVVVAALLLSCASTPTSSSVTTKTEPTPVPVKVISIVTGSHSPPGHPITLTMEKFKELAEQRTGGRVKVETHPAGSLYSAEEGLTATRIGTTQMWFSYEAPLSTVDPRWGVFAVPFLFKDMKHFARFKETTTWKSLLNDMEQKGLKVAIDPMEHESWTQMFDKSQFITKPEMAKGKKWRVMAGKIWVAAAQKLGVSSVTITATETYSSLQTGMVEGVITYASGGAAYKWAEVAKFCTRADITPGSASHVINTAFYNSLPADIKKIFDDIFKELAPYGAKLWFDADIQYFKDIETMGGKLYTLKPEEKDAFIKLMAPVVEEAAVPVVGAEIIKAAQDTAK